MKTQGQQKTKADKKSNLPHWGGTANYHGKDITLSNTCPIDNLLFMLARLRDQYPMLQETLRKDRQEQCHQISHIVDLCSQGDWTLGRIEWLHKICGYELQIHQKQTWDAAID